MMMNDHVEIKGLFEFLKNSPTAFHAVDSLCAMLQEQVRRAAVDCYASEGRYPQTIDYLVKHYGLVFDGERYSILYDAFASNIMPDIAVSIRGEDVP